MAKVQWACMRRKSPRRLHRNSCSRATRRLQVALVTRNYHTTIKARRLSLSSNSSASLGRTKKVGWTFQQKRLALVPLIERNLKWTVRASLAKMTHTRLASLKDITRSVISSLMALKSSTPAASTSATTPVKTWPRWLRSLTRWTAGWRWPEEWNVVARSKALLNIAKKLPSVSTTSRTLSKMRTRQRTRKSSCETRYLRFRPVSSSVSQTWTRSWDWSRKINS